MGYLRNRGTKQHPQWYIRFKDTDGKWKQRNSKQATKDAARAFLADVEARVRRGLQGMVDPTPDELARKSITVGELARRFLGEVEGVAGYSTPRIKDLAVYRAQARTTFKCRILPTLRDRPAASVTVADAKRLRDEQLAAGLKPGSVAHTLAYLSKLYTWAADVGLVECANPVAGCERTRSAEVLDYFGHAEVLALLAKATELARVGVAPWQALTLAPMVATAVYCGLRKGELFGLRWIDLALEAGRLDVNRSYRGLPKSGKKRHVPINPELAVILRAWRDLCPHTDEGLVFPVEAAPGRFRMGSKEDLLGLGDLLQAAECHVPVKPWHALRHTFASHFMMAGGNILTLQQLLGHADLKMTQRYAHLAPAFMAGEVARMTFAAPPPAGVADLGNERRRRMAEGQPDHAESNRAEAQAGPDGPQMGQAGNTQPAKPTPEKRKGAGFRAFPSVELIGIEPTASRVRFWQLGLRRKEIDGGIVPKPPRSTCGTRGSTWGRLLLRA